ncbi:GNAT family protein [Plantibacter flavus]|uniref:GNAT family N-acetyltransferase n=1 Tax=Plantibacter flavus TaxID=150123 RepID=UPI0023782ECC|nr:GNAT family protein [Plantibacter flavus]MDD9151172.1 GNAT family protein [Plantibacter flavus]
MLSLTDVWPLFGLEIRTPRLVLRLVRDEDLPGLIEAALAGIHDPAVMPFSTPWTDQPREQLIRETARHLWTQRAGATPSSWTLNLAILLDGTPIGLQDIGARDFAVTRTVGSGSWLTQAQQGKGLGIEMRAGMLQFAFDHLDAEVAVSDAAVWNGASLGVSRRLGYRDNGLQRFIGRPGELVESQGLRLHRDEFVRPDWTAEVTGLDAARSALLGEPSAE